MLEVGEISTRQHVFLLFCLFTIPITFTSPQILISMFKQDVWQPILIAYFLDAAIGIVYYVLGLRYPQQTIFQYCETILGPWFGKLTGLSFVLFFGGTATLILDTISSIINLAIMPETPTIVFSIIILLVSAYAINAGLEVIARLSEVIGPIIIFSLLVVILLNFNHTELENLLPVFQHPPLEVLKGSLLPASLFGICISMGTFMAYHNVPRETLKAKWIAITLGIVLALMSYLQMIAVLGVNIASTQLYPMFRLAQMIQVGDIIERLESVMVFFWIAGSFIAICVLYWESTLGLAQIFKLKKYQSLTPYTGGTILLLSVIGFRNATAKIVFLRDVYPVIAIFVEIFLISFLLIVSFLRHGKKTIYARKEGK
ncbi:endospore germination permease [Desulfosporosinus sp. SB140]|uniref:GerAB/ArcD/ProY family transporter n=1 Tax=Desulfosporosinus paludis TaxID=3115649 RepID=UPI003890BF2E